MKKRKNAHNNDPNTKKIKSNEPSSSTDAARSLTLKELGACDADKLTKLFGSVESLSEYAIAN